MKRLRTSALLLAAVSVALPAGAEKPDQQPEGSEFIDMPEEPQAEAAPAVAAPAEDERKHAGYLPGYRRSIAVGLSPHSPQGFSSLPGGLTPQFGAPVVGGGYRFGFTGYLQQPLRMSIGQRSTAYEGQQRMTLHGDPVVAGGSYGWFDHTLTVPTPWAQLNFHYGNDVVQATTIIGAWGISESDEAAQSYMPQSQVGITDAYLTFSPEIVEPIGVQLRVGAFSDRYGAMAQYHEGAYGASLIGAVGGVGTTVTVKVPFQYDFDLNIEGGFKGELTKPPRGLIQEGSNEHARSIEGSTLATHAHVGLGHGIDWNANKIQPMLHYIYSWSQDDRADPVDDPDTLLDESRTRPDGSLTIMGADFRANLDRFGYLYFGVQQTEGKDSVAVSDLVRILNTGSGKDLMERFWGFDSNGNGKILLVGGQYTLSLGTLLRYPEEFYGVGPDLYIGIFGIHASVHSPIEEFDDKTMWKYGTELTYSMLPWLAASGRIDHVMPDSDDPKRSFAVFSPKLVFRTGWNTREALTVQYATYALGSHVRVEGDDRLTNVASGNPDRHLFAVYGTMWW